jgi:hypothetical protein
VSVVVVLGEEACAEEVLADTSVDLELVNAPLFALLVWDVDSPVLVASLPSLVGALFWLELLEVDITWEMLVKDGLHLKVECNPGMLMPGIVATIGKAGGRVGNAHPKSEPSMDHTVISI